VAGKGKEPVLNRFGEEKPLAKFSQACLPVREVGAEIKNDPRNTTKYHQ
jgi:hypothetical protein